MKILTSTSFAVALVAFSCSLSEAFVTSPTPKHHLALPGGSTTDLRDTTGNQNDDPGVLGQVGGTIKDGAVWTKNKVQRGYHAVKDKITGEDDPEKNEATEETRRAYNKYKTEEAIQSKEKQEGLDDGVDAF